MPNSLAEVFVTMKDHKEQLDNLNGEVVELKEVTQSILENDVNNEVRLKQVEEVTMRIENTVLREGQDSRSMMREQVDRMMVLVETSMGYKTHETTQSHELRLAKLNTWSTVILKVGGGLFGAGGLVYFVIQMLTDK